MRGFSATTYGKWILAGEHSVLRGAPALVFPVYDCSMKFCLTPNEEPLDVEFSGPFGEELRLLFWSVVERALQEMGHKRSEFTGKLTIESHLPIGAGLGASAAICVGIGRWWMAQGWIDESELYEFSRSLENLFHGESSGVDIAASLTGQGMKFYRSGDWKSVEVNWQPNWYLSFCGKKGVTSDCVGKVKSLLSRNPETGKEIDNRMSQSVELGVEALGFESAAVGFKPLVESINIAESCFRDWGLVDVALEDHMKELKALGAVATKPTGSGGGGYVLSLWEHEPPKELAHKLISLPVCK